VTVTVHRYVGGPGPTVYLQAGQHGIELNGPAALRRLHGRLTDAEVAGTVVAVPVANALAFDGRSYLTPPAYDALSPNMNRVWPGDPDGGLQERLVASLWPLARDADAAVDLHTGTADTAEHVRVAPGPAARDLAEAFGSPVIVVDDDDGGTFRAAAGRAGVPTVTAELADSRTVAPAAVENGVEGVENALRATGVLPGDPTSGPDPTVLRSDDGSVRTPESGLFEPAVTVGDRVAAADALGVVYSPSTFEPLATVRSGAAGEVYSVGRHGTVIAGERVASVGRVVDAPEG
jgi:predicted deacylase